MGTSNFGCDVSASLCCLLGWTQWKLGTLYEEKKTTIHFLGIFTLLTLPYFYSAHIFVCMYIFMSIFSCLIVHVLHSNFFFLKYLEFSL